MKRLLLALALLVPSSAYATQTSILCKTTDSNEYIDIVSKGAQTNDVLVQINGGAFYDGSSVYMNGILIVTVSFDEGGLILNYNPKGTSSLIIAIKDKKQIHDVTCRFRQ